MVLYYSCNSFGYSQDCAAKNASSPVVLRRDVALGRAHVDARLVHAPVAELHLEGLMNGDNNECHGTAAVAVATRVTATNAGA